MSSNLTSNQDKMIDDNQALICKDIDANDITKLIAFYLPQYHPIPENDEWWGKGFTEWTNVAKSKPLFPGHYQPHLPADLGFYDLRLPEVREAQAKLAKEYGIHGFCYYHYWFNGRMVLEKPFNEVLDSGSPDFPFCLSWANENWTKRWDGLDQEVLLEQNYDAYDPIEHITWLEKAFRDSRYIRINGKPLFLVYKAGDIPKIEVIIDQWRTYIESKGYPGIYICFMRSDCTESGHSNIPGILDRGFDAYVDFQFGYFIDRNQRRESQNLLQKLARKIKSPLSTALSLTTSASISSYREAVSKALSQKTTNYKTFPCVFPSWDNSARRKKGQTITQNHDEELYGEWLEHATKKVQSNGKDEKIVFINAWNEWAEGCHLEPDMKNGHKFLEKTKTVIEKFK
jgi:lipopolysaccharide biosynthesis protein